MPDKPDTNKITEGQKAELATRRGKAAAQISDPKEKQEFIADQGSKEAKNKGDLPAPQYQRLSMGAALKGYKKGTDYVPETGPAMLDEGEAVLNKQEAKKMREKKETRAKSAMSGGKKKSKKKSESKKKKVHRMHIRHAANGGFIAEHEQVPSADGSVQPNEEHVLPDVQGLGQHVMDHFSGGPEEEQEQPQPQVPPQG